MLVLDQGRQVFYGPPLEARAYFENLGFQSLPRQSTADYLTGCTDPNERRFAPGRSTQNAPSTPEALEHAFSRSSYARDNQDSLEKYQLYMRTEKADQEAFRAAVIADKKKGVSKTSPYTLGFTGQVRALTLRQFQQKMQDKFHLYTSFSLSMVPLTSPFIRTKFTSYVTHLLYRFLLSLLGQLITNNPLPLLVLSHVEA